MTKFLSSIALAWAMLLGAAHAAGADALIRQLSEDVIASVKADAAIQSGDIGRINALVDTKVMPHVNFQKMTASAVGRHWRSATPEQRERLQAEFKSLLVRTYAGALAEVKDQSVALKPFRAAPTDTDVVVQTEVRGRGDPIQLDYRLEKAGDTWRIYDVNVLGVWLVQQYRTSFNQEIAQVGIDGLIARLAERNKAAAAKS
ncbi:MAG: phospholipid-binding protein MlaC [Gammaproteobacteria bacterium]|uniref:MlaC/ttg2D family ABC transporter substrate-binding protein n=1 Tax=Azohydromonas sp. TaxID=1872666 RepID=UPI002BF39132|nr:ABC transporter substrate-binding protein [Azohydromonas sp.]HMM85664.1 ABC transporter substrate-binding protein [Azohydromonas sp.]